MRPTKLATLSFLAHFLGACGSVTVYYQLGQGPLGTETSTASPANYTGAAAYDPTVLNPPAPPNPPIQTQFAIQLVNGGTPGVSIQQDGPFFGFSIEMSVVDQVLGRNSTVLQVPFLNLIANVAKRSGGVRIRVGGNTQETAVLVDSTPSGRILQKDISGVSNPTQTPPLDYTPDLIYMMGNISQLVPVEWYLGIPFNDTSNFRLAVAEVGQQVLGSRLIGLQVGNEPDLYARHDHRPSTYGPFDYFGEFGSLVVAMADDAHITNQNLLIGPNIATGDWTPEMVWNTGFVDSYSTNLAYLSVEHYPTDNCFAQFGVGTPQVPQDIFPSFLTHAAGQAIVQPYLNSTNFAQEKGKKLLMFETNTASCGGFAGISDSFGAALWGLDYGMQMAYSNFSGALFHVGGQNVFYNPFTPPPTNQSTFRAWTVGPIYYSSLVMAEALGPSNTAQVLDMEANTANPNTPAYTIYEGGNPVRVLLFNYITDTSGANDITVSISVGGGQTGQANATPTQVKVKYLLASSVSQKGNFTWAGQTFGANFGSDGRFQGQENITTITCDQTNNLCAIPVPAPGVALVFLTDSALSEVESSPTTTFPTTALTKTVNTATIDAAVLATSNGHSGLGGKDRLSSTSKGSISGSSRQVRERFENVFLASAVVSGLVIVATMRLMRAW